MGVSVDKSFGSKWLVNFLYKLGFSISKEEVLKFKQSVAEHSEDITEGNNEGTFAQWVGDNVDHNVATLTGKGTFHGMGAIEISNTERKIQTRIKRLKDRILSSESSVNHSGFPIHYYYSSSPQESNGLVLKPVQKMTAKNRTGRFLYFLWHAGWFFSSNEIPRPHWSGFMHKATSSVLEVHQKSGIKFLPILDLNPNDYTTVYSTMKFVLNEPQMRKSYLT